MDTAALSEAIFIGKLILGLYAIMQLLTSALTVAAFFRRQPSIDSTLTALIKEFNAQLQDRVLVRDFRESDARHNEMVRAVETRFSAAIVQVEQRIDSRMSGLHDAIVSLRGSNERILIMLQDIYKDGGWTKGRLEKPA